MTQLNFFHAAQCDAGRRQANDDCVHVDPARGIYLVCDGAGAKLGGRTAAETVCRTVAEQSAAREQQLALATPDQAQAIINEMLLAAHERILEIQQREVNISSMTTTAALLKKHGDYALISHIGDSRIYLYRAPELRLLTRDHNFENYMRDNPNFRPKTKPPGKTLVRALGLKSQQVGIEQNGFKLRNDDVILICSDGVSDSVPDWTLREILAGTKSSTVDDVTPALVRAALAHGSMDNVSALLIQATDRDENRPRTAVFDLPGGRDRVGVVLGWLAFVDGPKRGDVVPIEATLVIGAEPTCRICIDDGYVSRRHTEVFRTEHGHVLRDLGSTNGTFINNIRVTSTESALVDGDVIRIGKTEMVFKSVHVDS
ncbi:MAG: protein phosphatase 2C domain-containing protein [Myxococcales bacterium]|nr:protein phosphatase 2C domain-containing protein [Myxococcales bacterium]